MATVKDNQQSVQTFPFSPSMNRRRFLSYAGATLGTAALAACGSSGIGGTANGGGNSGLTISQWYHQYGEVGTQQAAMRYAKEYSSVKSSVTVKMQWIPGDYGGKLGTALLGNDGPDIFESQLSIDKLKSGQVADLTDLYTPDIKSDFNPISLNALTYNGKIYGVKMIDDMGLLYYRKSMLSQANVQPPKTFDEVIDVAKKLTTKNVKGLFAGNDGGIGALQAMALYSAGNGNDLIADNKVAFDVDRTALAWSKISDLNKAKVLLLGAPTDWWDPSAFTQGLVAMQWTGLWAMPAIKKALGDDFGVMPWPALDAQGTPATFWGGWAEMINAKSKHIDEAKAFVKWLWLTNTKDQQDWSLSYGFHVPPRKSAAASATALQSGTAAQAAQYLNQYGHTQSPLWDAAMGTAMNNAVSNIVKNNADAKSETSKCKQQCEAELNKLLNS